MSAQSVRLPGRVLLACLVFAGLIMAGAAVAQQNGTSTEPDVLQAATASSVAYDSASSTGRPPDDNPDMSGFSGQVAPSQTFRYYQVSGATLRGRNSSTGYAYDGVGCSHVTSGTGTGRILNTDLPLPDGAVIKYLRVYYRDTNAANGVEGYITRYQPGVGTADLVHSGSTNAFAGGYGFVVSGEITETVNNTAYAYTVIGWPDDANVANQICGLRVAYYAPVAATTTFLPALFRAP
jgi:hypothetical protein